MRNKHSTCAGANSSPLLVPESLTAWIAAILDGKRRDSGNTYTVLANPGDIRPCMFCNTLILPCVLGDGREYDAEVFNADDMELRVDFLSPHCCPEAARHEDFQNAPLEQPDEVEEL